MAKRPAGEITSDRSVLQTFRVSKSYFSGVSPTLAMYGGVHSCHVDVSLYELRDQPSDRILRLLAGDWEQDTRPFWTFRRFLRRMARRAVLLNPRWFGIARNVTNVRERCDALYDNSPLDVAFAADPGSEGKLYLLCVSSPDASPGRAPTVWLSDGPDRLAGHAWCSSGGDGQPDLGLVGDLGFSNPIADSPVPQGLIISPTTQCNLNCIHCVSRFTRSSVNRLAPEVRSLIAQWCHDGKVTDVATDYSGDLFWAEHRFGGELDFFTDLQVPLLVDTNGTHMTLEASRKLMRSRVRWVTVSLDAGTDETFRRVRKGAPPLAAVADNMRAMAAARSEAGRTDVVLSIGFTLMRSTIAELPAVLQLCRDVGFDLVGARHLEAYTPDMADESFWFDQAGFNHAREAGLARAGEMGVVLQMPRPFEPRPEGRGHHLCQEPWKTAMILGNGDVHVCCVPGPGMRMGNLREQPMEEIWNGPAYQDFRTRVNSANPPVACANCPMWRVDNNRGSYLTYEWTP